MSIRVKEKERRRNYFSCKLYVINTLMDYLSYLIQDDLIIKQTPLVSSLKTCKRVINSVKMKGSEGATHVPCFQWSQRISLSPAQWSRRRGGAATHLPVSNLLSICPTWPNSYPFKNSCHNVFISGMITISSCNYLFLVFHCAYIIAPNTHSFIKIALRCQVSHWSNTSI